MQGHKLNKKSEELSGKSDNSSPLEEDSKSPKIEDKSSFKDESTSKNKETIYKRIHAYLKDKYCTETEVVGVEIQPDVIRVCQAKQEGGKWHINKMASGNVLNTHNYESLTKNKSVYVKALKDIFKKDKITNKNIALSIPASMAIIKIISLPLMTKQNLDKATNIESFWKNLVQLSGNMKDYSIYYRIVETTPKTKEMDVLFVSCKNEDIDIYREISEEAGLYPVVADIGCFSINNLSKLKEEKSSNTKVYLKVGKDENYLQVLEDDKPYIYDIFVPENEKTYLNEYLDHQTFQQRFTSQLKHVITKHEDKHKSKITEINIISGEKQIEGFTKSLNKNLDKIKVSQADLFISINLPKKIKEDNLFKENNSAWAVSAGLATRNIQIFEDENKKSISETVNLLPESDSIREKLKAMFYSKIITGSVTLVGLLFILIFGVYSYGKYQSNYTMISEFNSLNAQYKEQQKIFNDINNSSGTLNKLIKLRDSLESNQMAIISAFQEVARSIPEGVWLEEVKIDEDNEISIQGRSFSEKNIMKFSKMFENSKAIANVNIGSMKTIRTDSGALIKEFVINGKLNN